MGEGGGKGGRVEGELEGKNEFGKRRKGGEGVGVRRRGEHGLKEKDVMRSLDRKGSVSSLSGLYEQTDRQTERQTNRQTNRQNRHTNRQTDIQRENM